MSFCKIAFYHEPGEICSECKLEVDDYENTEEDFLNCCFPDCGCDGERLCMAPGGANEDARRCNVENMCQRTDKTAQIAKLEMVKLCFIKSTTPK